MSRRLLAGLVILLLTAVAAAAPPHEAWTRAALDRSPVSRFDRTPDRLAARAQNLDVFAREMARIAKSAPLPARQWVALMASIGVGESNFDTAVTAGQCLRFQCDAHLVKGVVVFRAVGVFQQQNAPHVADLWPTAAGDIAAQVTMVDRTLRRSLVRCKPFATFPEHVYRAYAGSSCSFPTGRESVKATTYARVLATAPPKAGS